MEESPKEFRCGFVAIFGKPNAGKSTLMNKVVGARLAAVSPLPQTTRERTTGIWSTDAAQVIFVDLPGLAPGDDRLNECIRHNVIEGLEGVDLVMHLVDVNDPAPFDADIVATVSEIGRPLLLVLNKIDGKKARVDVGSWFGEQVPAELRPRYRGVVGISAGTGTGIDKLQETLCGLLPQTEAMYDPEILTDRDMRYLAQEMIREKAYHFLRQELPYAVAVQIDEFKEREEEKWYIRATIWVERDSQKGIVLGKGGETLKRISSAARRDIEQLCDAPVFLDLWVKVRDRWRKNDNDLRELGFTVPRNPGRRKN
ncbi:GTPase Era [bacterium]|nr:GTPase Era [bacterium]